jgi:hypothetical protein
MSCTTIRCARRRLSPAVAPAATVTPGSHPSPHRRPSDGQRPRRARSRQRPRRSPARGSRRRPARRRRQHAPSRASRAPATMTGARGRVPVCQTPIPVRGGRVAVPHQPALARRVPYWPAISFAAGASRFVPPRTAEAPRLQARRCAERCQLPLSRTAVRNTRTMVARAKTPWPMTTGSGKFRSGGPAMAWRAPCLDGEPCTR